MTGALAGIDIGASGVRAHLDLPAGPAEFSFDFPLPRRAGRIDVNAMSAGVAQRLRTAMNPSDSAHGFDVVCIGMAGLPDLVDAPGELADRMSSELNASIVVLAGDAVTTHIGALGMTPGTVIAAGTGVIALSTDLDQHWRRTDGWGMLLGDEGGGAWIGRHGLIAALRHADGRPGGSADLFARMLEEFGRPEQVVNEIYGAQSPSYLMGTFAPAVAQSANDGDSVAATIWKRAGVLLSQTAVATATGSLHRFSWNGGVFKAGQLVLEPFREGILAALPNAEIVAPMGNSATGALVMAREQRTRPRPSQPPFMEVFRRPRA